MSFPFTYLVIDPPLLGFATQCEERKITAASDRLLTYLSYLVFLVARINSQ